MRQFDRVPADGDFHLLAARRARFRSSFALPLPSAHAIELFGFADVGEIDPKYFDSLYYLGPGNGGERAYALLHRVLADSGKVGIGRIMIRMREHLAAVMATDEALAAQTLFYGDEVRQPDEVPGIPEDGKIHSRPRRPARNCPPRSGPPR